MNTPPSPAGLPAWFPKVVILLLALQLGLIYLQGSLLHRQQTALQDLRTDVQALTDTVEATLLGPEAIPESLPMGRLPRPRPRLLRIGLQETDATSAPEEEAARKEIEKARESARQAVKDAERAQRQISFEENARKVEAKKRIEQAGRNWTAWYVAGGALIAAALLGRSWLRRRG